MDSFLAIAVGITIWIQINFAPLGHLGFDTFYGAALISLEDADDEDGGDYNDDNEVAPLLVSGPMSPAALITTPHDVHEEEEEEGEEVGDDKERDGDQ